MGKRELGGRQERGDGHADAPAHKHGVPPDQGRRARRRRRHAREEGHEDDEGEEGRQADLLGGGRVQARGGGAHDDSDKGHAEADGHHERVRLVEHADLVGKVDVGREEGDALAKDAEQGDGEVAVRREEPVVEHAFFGELGLVDNQHDRQRHADGERGRHVGIRPRVRVVGPRKARAEEHEAGREQAVAHPVQPGHFLAKAEFRLQRERQGAVGDGEGHGRQEEQRHDNVREVTEPVRVPVAQQHAADDEAEQEPQARLHHQDALAPGAPLARQDLAGHGVEEGLGAKGDARDAEAGDDHVEAGGPGDDDGAHAPEETAGDGEPFPPPVVGGLGEDGAEDDGEDGQDGREPGRSARVVEDGRDGIGLLDRGLVG